MVKLLKLEAQAGVQGGARVRAVDGMGDGTVRVHMWLRVRRLWAKSREARVRPARDLVWRWLATYRCLGGGGGKIGVSVGRARGGSKGVGCAEFQGTDDLPAVWGKALLGIGAAGGDMGLAVGAGHRRWQWVDSRDMGRMAQEG